MKFPSYARTFKHIVHKTGFAGLKIPAQAFKKFEPWPLNGVRLEVILFSLIQIVLLSLCI